MFGDFINEGKHRVIPLEELEEFEAGVPIVAQYSDRNFQFAIYGENQVIYQDCWINRVGELVFSLEECSIEEFCEDAIVYEYIPEFYYDRTKTYINAKCNLTELGDKIIPASKQLRSVYGDDFTLMCMLDSIEKFYMAFQNSQIGRHYQYKFFIGSIFPAFHHLLAIEGGFAIHFSKGDDNEEPEIILETIQHIVERADACLIRIEYNNDDIAQRLLARNRALLIYSDKADYDNYDLFANNCEHFVHLCKTGRPYSNQVKNFFTDAVIIGLSLVARKPQYASMILAKRLHFFD